MLFTFSGVLINISIVIVPMIVFQALEEDVQRQTQREHELQQRYGELLVERDNLKHSLPSS